MKDPVEFRSQMSRHGAIISGSFALQFFERTMWPDADLDIWIEGVDEEDHDELSSLGFTSKSMRGIPSKDNGTTSTPT